MGASALPRRWKVTDDLLHWWNVADMARELGVTTQRAYQLVRAERVRSLRTRAGLLIEPSSVMALSALRASAQARQRRTV